MLDSNNPSQSLESLMNNIFSRRRITRATQQMLMASLLGKSKLNTHEQEQVQALFEAINQGRLRVVD